MPKAKTPKSNDRSHLTRRKTKIRHQDGSVGEGIRLFNDNPNDAKKSKALKGEATVSLADPHPEQQEPLKESIFNLLDSIGMLAATGENPFEQTLSLLHQTGREVNVYSGLKKDLLPVGVHAYDGKAFNFTALHVARNSMRKSLRPWGWYANGGSQNPNKLSPTEFADMETIIHRVCGRETHTNIMFTLAASFASAIQEYDLKTHQSLFLLCVW